MAARRFPWAALLALWTAAALFLTYFYWRMAITQNFDDPDDFLRLQQIRDFVGGQSWFDLTQRRLDPPTGLAMHWSRLVDIPVLLFFMPLTPLVGAHAAEIVATIGAPLLTLLALMIAVAAIARRLVGHDTPTALLACLLALSAPSVFLQIHPARIDHHGWQIVLAVAAIAALMQREARASGIAAGVALALYLNISIEGAPFAAAAIGIVALLWALGTESAKRLVATVVTLAITALVSTLITAPYYRWTEGLCDAVMPAHLAALTVAAVATIAAVRLTGHRPPLARIAALGLVAALTLAAFGLIAPQCLGSPFGRLDPVVDSYWYQNVSEGMPFWRQDVLTATSMLAFPLVGLLGTIVGAVRASNPERRRRWLVMLVMLAAAFVIGALVRRSAGVAHVLGVPGALVLIGLAVRVAERNLAVTLRSVATAAAILMLSPIMPIFAVASMISDPNEAPPPLAKPDPCDRLCVLARLAKLPPEKFLASSELGPIVLVRTPHSVYASGYHRMVGPLRDTILFFQGAPGPARAFMRAHGFRRLMISPESSEARLFVKRAPGGMMARLVAGLPPPWLVEEPIGSSALRIYRRID